MDNQPVIATSGTSGRRKTKTQEIRRAVGGATEDGEGEGNTGPCGIVVTWLHVKSLLNDTDYIFNDANLQFTYNICFFSTLHLYGRNHKVYALFLLTYILGNYRN